jgi:hypothetical protein
MLVVSLQSLCFEKGTRYTQLAMVSQILQGQAKCMEHSYIVLAANAYLMCSMRSSGVERGGLSSNSFQALQLLQWSRDCTGRAGLYS